MHLTGGCWHYMKLGIDIGSTTVKFVLLDRNDKIVFSRYERHMSNVFEKVYELMLDLYNTFKDIQTTVSITGSGGLSFSSLLEIPFQQEVIACSKAVETLIPNTDVAIELGGEDAKITFYGPTIEQRMNGTCAGGTGAFIDQMAILLNTDAQGLNEHAKNYNMIYPIAARCGVFAKTDIQPLINDGASIEDLSVSIFQAVVNQTISGLACGRTIRGNVAFLGGPLSFLSELRKRFVETLELKPDQVIFPEGSEYYVAIGAALLSDKHNPVSIESILSKIENADTNMISETKHMEPLFKDYNEYQSFKIRHDRAKIKKRDIRRARGKVFLGIDAGSTTTKAALIDDEKYLLYSFYKSNEGKPIETTMATPRFPPYLSNACFIAAVVLFLLSVRTSTITATPPAPYPSKLPGSYISPASSPVPFLIALLILSLGMFMLLALSIACFSAIL
jgi:predicted CoA-substrate-specific enzyme activase